jgi:hypothetical protein
VSEQARAWLNQTWQFWEASDNGVWVYSDFGDCAFLTFAEIEQAA